MRGPRVIYRDEKGRFVRYRDRYRQGEFRDRKGRKIKIALVQAKRGDQYVDVGERALPPDVLVNVLSQREFESLPEATTVLHIFKSSKKYKAWDISEQIDKHKGIRRKEIKLVVTIQDGRRKKEVSVYHRIKSNAPASYSIFRRINDEIGFAGGFLYNTVNGKHLSDRKGKKVKLVSVRLEQIL